MMALPLRGRGRLKFLRAALVPHARPPRCVRLRRTERATGDNGLSLLVSDCKFFYCGKNTRRDTIGK